MLVYQRVSIFNILCLHCQDCHTAKNCFRNESLLFLLGTLQVIRSNNFAISPVLVTLPTLDGFDVRFQAAVALKQRFTKGKQKRCLRKVYEILHLEVISAKSHSVGLYFVNGNWVWDILRLPQLNSDRCLSCCKLWNLHVAPAYGHLKAFFRRAPLKAHRDANSVRTLLGHGWSWHVVLNINPS